MPVLSAESLAAALGGKARGDRVSAPAPGHSKADRSLSIKVDPSAPDGFVVKAFAGEDAISMRDYVREKAGLPPWQPGGRAEPTNVIALRLKAQPAKPFNDGHLLSQGYHHAAVYDYASADGELLFQVLRYEHAEKRKTFLQRQPDGNGGWLSGRGEPILYRLPDIASRPTEPVYVVEGEKDADTLADAGLLATTVPNGSWPEDLSALQGRSCIVLADNDAPGQDKAAKAVEKLTGVASVRRLDLPGLPPKGDVTDWLTAGNTVADLQRLVAAAPPMAANDNRRGKLVFIGEDAPYSPKPELVRDTMPRTGVGFFGGQSGAFKTFFAIHAATCFMTGEPLAGRDIERIGGIVYLAAEGEVTIDGRLKARRSRLADPDETLPFYLLSGMGAIADQRAYQALEARLKEAATNMRERFDVPLVAVIIDTVAAAGMIAEDKENDPGAWQKIFDALQPISARMDAVVILIHHAGKNASAGLRGSSNARAGADFALMLACDRDEITGLTANHFLHLAKSRDSPEGPIAAIKAEPVAIGAREDGSPITSLVLDFDIDRRNPERRPKVSKSDRPFREAFDAAMIDVGREVRVHGASDAPLVRAVPLETVRDEFSTRCVTGQSDPTKRADAIRKQFGRAVERAEKTGWRAGSWDGCEWIWRISEPDR